MQGLFILCGLLATPAIFAVTIDHFRDNSPKSAIQLTHQFQQYMKVGMDLCPTCIEFAEDGINELVNIVLNLGVVGSCNAVCSLLAKKTGSQILGLVCDLLCDYVGIDEFIKFIQKADLDPFLFCDLVKVCPEFENGDANITELYVSPVSGPQGSRTIAYTYESKNGTGTGEIILLIKTVDGLPVENGFIHEQQPAGIYPNTFQVLAKPDPHCDPTQEICEQWLPGNYTAEVYVCYGECGSVHPHSKIYDKKQTGFIITN